MTTCDKCGQFLLAYAEMRRQRDALLAAAKEVIDLAAWHTDDNAEETDVSPEDMVAHVNGLIRQRLTTAVKEAEHDK